MTTRRRRKALGQHFLRDPRTVDRILDAADLGPEQSVLEIGPGTGALTLRLADRVGRLVAVEKDPELARRLQLLLAPHAHVEVHEADATDADLGRWGPYDRVVANLPYSVSTPITFRLFHVAWRQAVLMYQREFAQRLVAAAPGDAEYGRLGAACAYWAEAEYLFTVPPGAFQPPPDVSSGVVRLRRHTRPPFDAASPAAYEDALRILFSTRRKTLRATFRHQHALFGLPDADAADRLVRAWGHADERPDEVPPSEYGRLTRLLEDALA